MTTLGSGPRSKCLCFCKVAHPNRTDVCDVTRPAFAIRTHSPLMGEIGIPVCIGCFNAREIRVGPDDSAPTDEGSSPGGEGEARRSHGLQHGRDAAVTHYQRVAAPQQQDRGLYVPRSLLSARIWLCLSSLLWRRPR